MAASPQQQQQQLSISSLVTQVPDSDEEEMQHLQAGLARGGQQRTSTTMNKRGSHNHTQTRAATSTGTTSTSKTTTSTSTRTTLSSSNKQQQQQKKKKMQQQYKKTTRKQKKSFWSWFCCSSSNGPSNADEEIALGTMSSSDEAPPPVSAATTRRGGTTRVSSRTDSPSSNERHSSRPSRRNSYQAAAPAAGQQLAELSIASSMSEEDDEESGITVDYLLPTLDEKMYVMTPPLRHGFSGQSQRRPRKTLVLDLDETLVHSSFKPLPAGRKPSFTVDIELQGQLHRVYVMKRPFVDEFLRCVCAKFEVVIFTASLGHYANPLLDILDPKQLHHHRLFREACTLHFGRYVKDLTQLGRDVKDCIILDNSPFSYMFQPENAIAITSWFHDQADQELKLLIPFLNNVADSPVDVRDTLAQMHQQYCASANQ
jgi:Dullard-like phosphatase family protein